MASECGLGLLLTHCGFLLKPPAKGAPDSQWLEGLRSIASYEMDAKAEDLPGWEEMQEEDKRACAALPGEQRQRAPWHFIAAARRGHLPSMRRLVMGIGVDEAALLSDRGLYEVFQQERGQALIRLIEWGDPFGAMAWADALSGEGTTSLAVALPREWKNQGVALALNRRVQHELRVLGVADLSRRISDADEKNAERLFARHFETSELLQQERERLVPDRLRDSPRAGRDLARPPLRECEIEYH